MKNKTLNRIMSDDEIVDFLNYLNDSGNEIEKEVKKMFIDVIFIGTSINKKNKKQKDAFIVNLEICNYYFKKTEDYLKVKQLTELYHLFKIKKKVYISRKILKNISVNLN